MTKTGAAQQRLSRSARREQILTAAAGVFAAGGFAATSLDDIASAAGVTRAILYRHFDSKADLYRALLYRAAARLGETVGTDQFGEDAIPALVTAAAHDPDGFRLLFRHAAREPEFRAMVDQMAATSVEVTRRNLAAAKVGDRWLDWLARLLPVITIEAVLAWLDVGQPDPDGTADRIARIVHAALESAMQANQPQ